jgi:hypothetical protein
MSTLATNAITDAAGGNTATINSYTPTESNMAGRNRIINGAMQVAQRGTSTTGVTTTDGYYACDRWRTQTDYGTWTISQDTDSPNGFSNSLKLDCTTAGTSNSDEISVRYYMEGQDAQGFGFGTADAKPLTVSFWIKSNKTGTYTVRFYIEDTGNPEISRTFTIDTADTWEYKTVSVPANTSNAITNDNTFGFGLFWYFGAASGFTSTPLNETWGSSVSANSVNSDIPGLGGSTNDYVNITGVQLEAGSVATPFERRQYGQELALCQRYYYRIKADAGGQVLGSGMMNSATAGRFFIPFMVPMRTSPTALEQSGTATNYVVFNGGSAQNCGAVPTFNSATLYGAGLQATIASGGTIGYGALIRADSSAAYLGWSAEL